MIKYYKVGGWVRDKIIGCKSKDVDFAVEASSYQEMKDDILSRGCKIYLENPEFLTIRASHPEFGGVDYVLCRKDGPYSDGRHPDSVEIGTIYNDLARREFGMNAMAIDENDNLIDPFGGRCDIAARRIRCVGNAFERFSEDSLRILRAIRFSIKYDFWIEYETSAAMHRLAIKIFNLPEDRIREELEKCFKINTNKTLTLLSGLGLMDLFDGKKFKLWLMPTSKEK